MRDGKEITTEVFCGKRKSRGKKNIKNYQE